MKTNRLLLLCSYCILAFTIPTYCQPKRAASTQEKTNSSIPLKATDDFQLSPYTGYTRAHWLEITEKIIAGVMPYIDAKTGHINLPEIPDSWAFKKLSDDHQTLDVERRHVERLMIAPLFYYKATGKDYVPGYKGSITSPFLKAIINGTDPQSKDFWKGHPDPLTQVGSMFSLAVYMCPEKFWDPLTAQQKINLLDYLRKHVYLGTSDNNWFYFRAVSIALLDRNGAASNREVFTKGFERIFGFQQGDGWFMDGTKATSNRGFDYYNFGAFHMYNSMLYRYDTLWREQFGKRIEQVTAQFLKGVPYFYGRDGGHIPWGRSLNYRFISNAPIAWAVLNGYCSLPLGQARHIVSGSLKYFWERGCLSGNGLLPLGYWGENASVPEWYLAQGDAYWAMQGMACILIPESDSFWTAKEEPIPADGTGGKIALKGPQFSVKVSPVDGEARLLPAGQPFAWKSVDWQSGEKYQQHAYSSYLGFCLMGEGADQIGQGRTGYSFDGTTWFYREKSIPLRVEAEQLSGFYYLQTEKSTEQNPAYSKDQLFTTTFVGNEGEVHIFWHNYPDAIYLHLGGYGIQVASNTLTEETIANGMLVKSDRYSSLLQAVDAPPGKFESVLLQPRAGWADTHLFGGKGAFPFWRSTDPVKPYHPVVFYVNGARDRSCTPAAFEMDVSPGVMRIRFEGKWFSLETMK